MMPNDWKDKRLKTAAIIIFYTPCSKDPGG